MAGINKRVFGSDIPPKVKQKLELRQAFAESAAPFDSLEGVDQISPNFKGFGDLSSRTPFARMWTAVAVRKWEIPSKIDNVSNNDGEGWDSPKQAEARLTPDQYDKGYRVRPHNKNYYIMKSTPYDSSKPNKVYIIGNHQLNYLEQQDKASGSPIIPDEFESNRNGFMRPPAGITSTSSETQGTLGAIKKTTINFIIHNFHDFENIYSRYFLRHGAQVFVDFGWDTLV